MSEAIERRQEAQSRSRRSTLEIGRELGDGQLGQTALIGAFSRQVRPALMGFFARRVRNHAEAEDLTQDVLTRLAARPEMIEAEYPHAYIFQVAANVLRDRKRRQSVRQGYQSEQMALFRIVADEIDPGRILESRETLLRAIQAVGELPESTRRVFLLHRLNGMKQKDIAAALGMGLRTVEQHMADARRHLADYA